MFYRLRLCLLAVFSLVFGIAIPLVTQTAQVSGLVSDTAKAVIPGASVEIVNQQRQNFPSIHA